MKSGLASYFALLVLCVAYTSATCPVDGRRTLMHRDKLDMVDIGTNDVISDYTPHIVAFLDTCTFTPLPDKPMFGQCQAACNRNRDCLAMYLATGTGCELCLATASGAGGNGNDYDVRKILIMAEALRDFINGRCFEEFHNVVSCSSLRSALLCISMHFLPSLLFFFQFQ